MNSIQLEKLAKIVGDLQRIVERSISTVDVTMQCTLAESNTAIAYLDLSIEVGDFGVLEQAKEYELHIAELEEKSTEAILEDISESWGLSAKKDSL